MTTEADAVVDSRAASELPLCVEALRRAHEVDRYPMVWPADPVSWLSPADALGAWVARAGRSVVGHIVLSRVGCTHSAVSRLFVVPDAQGRGLAVALLEAATEHARAIGRSVELDVVGDSVAAIRLYERLGWTLVEREPAPFTWPDGTRPMQRRYTAPVRG